MHIVVRESRDLDEAATPRDLGLAPADVVFLSFSDSDLAVAATAFHSLPEAERPRLSLANLSALRHPMSVDLFIDATVRGSKVVLVRLLGGLDYWRYGGEQLSKRCRELGVALAIVPGDSRPDFRLTALSTFGATDLARVEALMDAGGVENMCAAIRVLLARVGGSEETLPETQIVPGFGVYHQSAMRTVFNGSAALVFYRSHLLAGDLAPIDCLVQALEKRGLAVTALYVPSLKAADAARWLQGELQRILPSVILNATAFAACDGSDGSPLDGCDCPVLQVALSSATEAQWQASQRGLGAADLAMNVVLPELDGRIFAGVISFKGQDDLVCGLGPSIARHVPYAHGIGHVADLASGWTRLRAKPRTSRRIGLMLSTYPGRPDQIAHAVGLDGLQSALEIGRRLGGEGYAVSDLPESPVGLVQRLEGLPSRWPLEEYRRAFNDLPEEFRETVFAAWGPPEDDAHGIEQSFEFRAASFGNLVVGLQPERGQITDRKAQYHDPATPPRHSYVAFYVWLRHVAGIDALIHLGAHGTLEWLPGKAVAGSGACAPRAVLGPLPLIYPFIVNDPGEAAQAKRRAAAVTLGHRPPPMTDAGLAGPLSEVERLVDEFSSADGLDPRRRKVLSEQITDAAAQAGIAERCGLEAGMNTTEALMRIDAFLCDVKELSIRDGLHVLDDTELAAIVRSLDGRFIEPGPAGAPSRGRADVLPTGRNLFSVDPRAVPTPTAWANGRRAAKAILDRYVSDHGEWPRAIVLDLWGSATLRTGGEELATALALLGAQPVWDQRSYRVTGIETQTIAELGRPRIDVTLRISGLFRDMFGAQLTLFDSAVALVAQLQEEAADNPLAGTAKTEPRLDRIFGPADGSFGSGVMQLIDRGTWTSPSDLGRSYIEASAQAFGGDGASRVADGAFEERVRCADAFVHIQDHREIDLLTGGDFAAHEGGFAAAAAAAGNADVTLYHGDTGAPETPRVRTLDEECARVIHGRAANPRWVEGQMRHGFRGAAEMAQSVDAAFAFAATARAVDNGGFERLYEAYLGDPAVAAFLSRENPAAVEAMRRRFAEAVARGLWRPRRNDIAAPLKPSGGDESSREAAE